jgi:1-aminocyclopropane-1-carboxylate deaminase
MNEFKEKTGISLDPIYTGKMVFGIIDMIKKNLIDKNSKILVIHTGGLQGIKGVNEKLRRQNLPLIR